MRKQEEFMGLFKPCYNKLWNFILYKVSDEEDARDILSDAIMIAFEKFDTIKDKNSFTAFIFTIARRLIYLYWKENKREKSRIENIEIDLLYGSELNAEDKTDLEHFYSALKELPDKLSEALILYEIHGFSREEIAQIQDTNISNIKQRLYRARNSIKKILGIENVK